MLKKSYLTMVFALILAAVASCVVNPIAQRPSSQELLLPSFEDLLPGGPSNVGQLPGQLPSSNPSSSPGDQPDEEPDFLSVLASYRIQLTASEIQQLKQLLQTQPSGKWARSQSQTAEQVLLANYRRFGPAFTPTLENAEEYRVKAVTFAEKTNVPYYMDVQYYLDEKRLLVIKWDSDTGEYIVIQSSGALVNYLITRAIQPPRYLEIDL